MNPNNSAIQHQTATAIQNLKNLSFSKAEIQILKTTILDDQTTNEELLLFGMICQQTGLSPFAKQIYGIRRKGKLTFQCAIDGYRLIADRTGKYAGNDDPRFDEGLSLYEHLTSTRGNPVTATVTVWKVVGGVRCAFTASASWQQYAARSFSGKLTETWQKMPHLMLSKCAETLALRKAFPNELSALRTLEEMEEPTSNPAAIVTHPESQPAHPKPHLIPQQDPFLRGEAEAIIKDLKLTYQQLQLSLLCNFNKDHLDTLTDGELIKFTEYLKQYGITSDLLKILKWTPQQGKQFLADNFAGKKTRAELTLNEISDFVDYLKTEASDFNANPTPPTA